MPRTYRGRDVLWWMENSGPVEPALRRDGRSAARARGLPSPQLVGTPERVTLDLNALSAAGVEAGRPAGRRARRPGAVLGRPAQSVRAGGPEDGADAGHVRPVGPRSRARCRGRPAGALRAHRAAGVVAARPRSAERRDPLDRLGHGVASGLQLAGRAGARSQGLPAARRRRRGCARPVCPRACPCCAAASPPSSTAPRTTRAT